MSETIPSELVKIVESLRELEGQYIDISYRSGTNGQRGLYQKRKSVLSKMADLKRMFVSDEYRLVQTASYPVWFIGKIEK